MVDQRRCPQCDHLNRPGARFCAQCGSALGPSDLAPPPGTPEPQDPGPTTHPPRAKALRWRRQAGQIAVRLEEKDLPGRFHKELVVEEGTLALLLVDGKASHYKGPGRYTFQGLWDRIRSQGRNQTVTAYLLDGGEIHLEFQLQDLWSQDPLRLQGRCQVALEIQDPLRFVRNVVKEQRLFTQSDLRRFLYPELRAAAQAFVGDHTVAQLEESLAQREEFFGIDLQERLGPILEQSGLAFHRVRLFDLAHPAWDELRQQAEELFLGPQKLESRKRLADLYDQEQLQALAEEEAEAARFEMRAELWQRMRQAVLQDKINAATSDEEWEQFVADLDQRRLLREDELAQFREQLRWSGEDRRKERAHVLAMADVYAEYELKAARLSEQFRHDKERLLNELELAREETLGRLDLRRRQVELELEIQELQRQRAREQERLDDLARRERAVQDAIAEHQVAMQQAQTELERARIRVQIERLEDDNALLTAEKAQAMMRRNREEKLRIQREHQIKMLQAKLEAEERRLTMRLREQAQAHRQELERIQALSQASLEAIIATSGPEQAALLAGLKRTEILKEFSEEQILAMAVEKRPEVIQALQVKFQALAEGRLSAAEAEKWKALAELAQRHQAELRAQMESQLDRQERQAREAAERQERLANEALRAAKDIAEAFAKKPDSGPHIVFGPGSGGYAAGRVSASLPSDRVQVCPNCRVETPVGDKYCANCGHPFYQ